MLASDVHINGHLHAGTPQTAAATTEQTADVAHQTQQPPVLVSETELTNAELPAFTPTVAAAAADAAAPVSAVKTVMLSSESAQAAASIHDADEALEKQPPVEALHSSSTRNSFRADSDSEPSTPASDGSEAQASSGPSSQLGQQIAVLSLLAGVAADPAATLACAESKHDLSHDQPLQAEDQTSDPNDRPTPLTEQCHHALTKALQASDVSVAGSSNGLAREGSFDLYDALREDRGNSKDWHVVKAGRKSGINTAKPVGKSTDYVASHDHQQQQLDMTSRGRDRLAESQLRTQDTGQEAVHVNGDAAHVSKSVRRCPSGTSVSSGSSAEPAEAVDRYEQVLAKNVYWLV